MTDDDKIEFLAGRIDGARWCMIGCTGQIARPLDKNADWPRTRYTLGLALTGLVVKSQRRPSLGVRLIGMDPAFPNDLSVFAVDRGAVHQLDHVVIEPTTTEESCECQPSAPGVDDRTPCGDPTCFLRRELT